MSRTAMLFAAALLLALPVQLYGQSAWNELVDLFDEWREFERPEFIDGVPDYTCLLYTSPSPRDGLLSRMPSSA